ncbi:hypothetical protein GCM10010123_37840 [Pilimelia anulata]|uniref:Uncharacterized protein n=1 Tax=Pilimelia anulata TaxID=53371 RepID=A0A8J3BF57_9ACTN|nr:hypothetical protein [Pilimelia anulata]GGK04341.1 hypothetical protein GCM10010123_37840 [Pilimelia anulata]
MVTLARRLLTPAGLFLAAMCFALPFVTASCEGPGGSVSATVSGVNMAGIGEPAVERSGIFAGGSTGQQDGEPEPQGSAGRSTLAEAMPGALARLALAAILAAIVLSVLPAAVDSLRPGWRAGLAALTAGAVVVAAAAATAAVLSFESTLVDSMVRNQGANVGFRLTRDVAESMLHVRFGFWLVLAVLAAALVSVVVNVFLDFFGQRIAHGVAGAVVRSRYGNGPAPGPPGMPPP